VEGKQIDEDEGDVDLLSLIESYQATPPTEESATTELVELDVPAKHRNSLDMHLKEK